MAGLAPPRVVLPGIPRRGPALHPGAGVVITEGAAMSSEHIQGTVADGYESVREEFAAVATEEGGDYAAQFVAHVARRTRRRPLDRPGDHGRLADRRVLLHQGRRTPGGRAAGAGRRAGPRRARQPLLAGVRRRGQGRDHAAGPPGAPRRLSSARTTGSPSRRSPTTGSSPSVSRRRSRTGARGRRSATTHW